MTHVVVLLASPEKDFESGLGYPRSLIEVKGIPVIQRFVESQEALFRSASKVTFVVRKEHNKKYFIGEIIKLLFNGAEIIELDGETKGAACSVLMAIENISEQDPLFLMSGDEILDIDLTEVGAYFSDKAADGGVLVFDSIHPRFSFVRINDGFEVIEAAEKRPISNRATVGCYYYSKGRYCTESIQTMIAKGAHTLDNYYICPAFNEMILLGLRVVAYEISKDVYHPLKSQETIASYDQLLG